MAASEETTYEPIGELKDTNGEGSLFVELVHYPDRDTNIRFLYFEKEQEAAIEIDREQAEQMREYLGRMI